MIKRLCMLAFAIPLASCGPPVEPAAPAPSLVLMVVVDALRPDHLGCYGHSRPTSPKIDAFARDAVLFENAFATSSWTKPSVPSIFTGKLPSGHGVFEGSSKDRAGKISSDLLSSDEFTLAESLRQAGYRTGAFVKNAQLKPFLGFDQGFDRYDEGIGDAPAVHAAFLKWFDQQRAEAPEAPVFGYVHVLDVHWPYLPTDSAAALFPLPEGARSLTRDEQKQLRDTINDGVQTLGEIDREAIRTLYDGCIRGYDDSFGTLLEALAERDALEDALIIFTSDHGEEFGENGRLGHGHSLSDALLRVPLIVRLPGGRRSGTVNDSMVSLIDLFPTVGRLCGAEVPDSLQGKDLFAAREQQPVFAELLHGRSYSRTARGHQWKLVERYEYLGASRPDTSGTGRGLASGLRVEVKGNLENGSLRAERLTLETGADSDFEIRGPITELDPGRRRLRLGPIWARLPKALPIRVRDAEPIQFEALALGDVIELDGELSSKMSLDVDKAELRPDRAGRRSFKLEGIIDRVWKQGRRFSLGGIRIEVEPDTELRGFGADARILPEKLPREALAQEQLSNDQLFTRRQVLHALPEDPSERVDQSAMYPEILKRLTRRLARLRGGLLPATAAGNVELDQETINELKAIGYIGD